MIQIEEHEDGILITGHAGPAPDLVCEDVTALYQCLTLSLEKLTDDYIVARAEKGFAFLAYQRPISQQAQLLIEAFFVGVCAISNTYPDRVRTSRLGTT